VCAAVSPGTQSAFEMRSGPEERNIRQKTSEVLGFFLYGIENQIGSIWKLSPLSGSVRLVAAAPSSSVATGDVGVCSGWFYE